MDILQRLKLTVVIGMVAFAALALDGMGHYELPGPVEGFLSVIVVFGIFAFAAWVGFFRGK